MSARILIVEDEAIVAADLEERLLALGYSIVGTVATGASAIERANDTKPDLVLMDVVLRGPMDGIEAAAAIHGSLGTPIVYVTASADQETLERLRTPGAYGYVRKPFDDRTLEMNIELACVKHAADLERAQTIKELEEALARVRTLEGLLPICAQCKKIRDGEGSWSPVEVYISAHTDASFTHGYCPECHAAFLAQIGR